MLVADGVSSVVEVPEVDVPDDEEVDPDELDAEPVDDPDDEPPLDVELPPDDEVPDDDDPDAESASLTTGGTKAMARTSREILRIRARASCDRSISSRPTDVSFHD